MENLLNRKQFMEWIEIWQTNLTFKLGNGSYFMTLRQV